jgi:hypothetical protein
MLRIIASHIERGNAHLGQVQWTVEHDHEYQAYAMPEVGDLRYVFHVLYPKPKRGKPRCPR